MKAARVLSAFAIATLLGAMGCEVLVDFDRTKIDAGPADGSISEGGLSDAPTGDAVADASDGAPGVDASDGGADASDAGDDASDADLGDAADAAD